MAYVEKTGEVLEPAPLMPKYIQMMKKLTMCQNRYTLHLSETNTTYAYKLTIGGKGGIIANESMIGYF